MDTDEVLSMYENIADITRKIAFSVQEGDFGALEALGAECVDQASAMVNGVPPLEGPMRQRKVELLKQIMASDRAVREVTEPWADPLKQLACPSSWIGELKPSADR